MGFRMGDKSQAFAKGGCGCLIAFAVIGVLVLAIGGSVHIDPLGAVCLFVVGGLIGLGVLMIYNKGKNDADKS